jgi:hypothetical protein
MSALAEAMQATIQYTAEDAEKRAMLEELRNGPIQLKQAQTTSGGRFFSIPLIEE